MMTDRKIRKSSEVLKRQTPYMFSHLIQMSETSLPLELQNNISSDHRLLDAELSKSIANKIRVILKVTESKDTHSCLMMNKNQNCLGLIDPTPSRRNQVTNHNINMFTFDSIFTEDDNKESQLLSALVDPIMSLFHGKDTCMFTFGNSGLGKTKTMIGSDQSMSEIGLIPCAIVWIFKMLDRLQLSKTTKYVVRISAREIGARNTVRDLLSNLNVTSSSGVAHRLEESHAQLLGDNEEELTVNGVQVAARILDAILGARSNENDSLTHLHMIIHLHKYKIDTNKCIDGDGDELIAAEPCVLKSRLHFLDLGSGRHGNEDPSALSLQGMSKVILALYTSQLHIPYMENIVTQVLKDICGLNASATMLVHISNKEQNYNDTLQMVQLASKLYRTRSKKSRPVGLQSSVEVPTSSGAPSIRRLRPHMGIGSTRHSSGRSSASSELDLTTASEQSCCETVIYRGNASVLESYKRASIPQLDKVDLHAVSSESDFIFSDTEGHVSSGTNVSRLPRVSPRTNARAWPPTNEGPSIKDTPELWIDGPNAIYSAPCPAATKPQMVSKETQCDDTCDSGSSNTSGSSLSNTIERKDNRPLSDISECTEDTESNLAAEIDMKNTNAINDMCPDNEVDDLLESILQLNTSPQDMEGATKIADFIRREPLTSLPGVWKDNPSTNTNTTTQVSTSLMVKNSSTEAKNDDKLNKDSHSTYHKEGKSKSKGRKRSTKVKNPTSKLTTSNSTDFSMVKSWLQSIECGIEVSPNEDTSHYHSQHDIFAPDTRFYAQGSTLPEGSKHAHFPSDTPGDLSLPQYSVYAYNTKSPLPAQYSPYSLVSPSRSPQDDQCLIPKAAHTHSSMTHSRPPLPPRQFQEHKPLEHKRSLFVQTSTNPTSTRDPYPEVLVWSNGEQGDMKMQDMKSKDKRKGVAKNIWSIIFGPFKNLRNKMTSDKNLLERQTQSIHHTNAKSMTPKGNPPITMKEWPDLSYRREPTNPCLTSFNNRLAGCSGTESDSSSLRKGQGLNIGGNHGHGDKAMSSSRQRLGTAASSGYGSIIIRGDSELSSHNDSSSEYSISGPKITLGPGRMKPSISLYHYKSSMDNFASTSSSTNNENLANNIAIAQDHILREQLMRLLEEEHKLACEYVEVMKIRGTPVDPLFENLACFIGIDHFDDSKSTKRNRLQTIIDKIDREMKQFKQIVAQAQNSLVLITSFHSKSQ